MLVVYSRIQQPTDNFQNFCDEKMRNHIDFSKLIDFQDDSIQFNDLIKPITVSIPHV